MCNNTFNIKVVEGNAFPLIVRLQALSYEAVPPIAEQIDYTRLTDCVLKVGGVEYEVEITEEGVRAIMPATLALGDYNVVFTAKYEGSDIRAAYLRAITIVKWNEQSNAGECLLGSPVVLPAAVVIGGTLTDAELDELKDEFREKNAQLAQAIEDAEAAKAEWERKAAELDNVAQETTLVHGVQDIRGDIAGINTSDLAKEATLVRSVQDIIGAMPIVSGLATENNATENKEDILAAIQNISAKPCSGHLDEIGLSQIGWGEDDISWMRRLVDWEESADEAMKVPQQLIDAYADYKSTHSGVVDSGFYTLHKTQWYFRYAPVVTSYPSSCLQNATYMLACPAKFHEYASDYGAQYELEGCGRFRYVPPLKFTVPGNHALGSWMNTKKNMYILIADATVSSQTSVGGLNFYNSEFIVLYLTFHNFTSVSFGYAPISAKHLFVDAGAPIINMGSLANPNWLENCNSCYLKGLACSVRMIQPYLTKNELLYAINNEASDGTTPYVITLSAAMYSLYSTDADIIAALSNHSNFALASA